VVFRYNAILYQKVEKRMQKLPIGISDFKELIEENIFYYAVQQIQEKAYTALVKKRGYQNILAFGVVFDGKRVWVKSV